MFLPSYIELVTAYPTCWITRTLHERPPIWFAVTHDCCFSLGAPTGRVIADKVLYYFEDTYIGRVRRNAPQCSPLFPIKELPRTKNNIEAWHNSFQANVSSTERRTHCSSKNASKPSRTRTGTTKTQIR